MKYKSRDISTLEFLDALQREYISLQIRRKIYIHKNDKDYFKNLLDKKRQSILLLAGKNRLTNIIEDETEYMKLWLDVVPKYGMPNFIYNIVNTSDKKLSFPYRGTVVKCGDFYGMSDTVHFDSNEILVSIFNKKILFSLNSVKRASHQETDEYFYYYPGNSFNSENGKCILQEYDMIKKEAIVSFDGQILVNLPYNKISRIL